MNSKQPCPVPEHVIIKQNNLYSLRFADWYSSTAGAYEQALHVFIQGNNLLERWQSPFTKSTFTIIELGFGLGRNFLSTRQQGITAENIAKEYLTKAGLHLVAKNFYCQKGEIDLIMQDKSYLVFVEVRYRKNNHFGSALETVTKRKQRRIIFASQYFLTKKRLQGHSCRFDVIALEDGRPIQWVKNAFQVDLK